MSVEKFLILLAILLLGLGISQLVLVSPRREVKKTTIIPSVTSVPTNSPEKVTTKVARVIDGDTIELIDGQKVRYIGIDTPELVDPRKPVECFGKEAREANNQLVNGKNIYMENDVSEVDKYGRLLRYVYVDNLMVNDYLVQNGFARASTIPPDVKYKNQFIDSEQVAREGNRGLWKDCIDTLQITNKPINTNINPSITGLCVIKGNISANGDKIYHLPGCGSYAKTAIDESTGERWFCSETEAQNAGWRKAKNCLQ